MFGFGMPELILILVIALIVFGPQKLPDLARSIGKGLAELKRATEDFKQTIEDEATSHEVGQSSDTEATPVSDGGAGKDVPTESPEKKTDL